MAQKELSKSDTKKLQEVSLKMLLYFDDFCKAHTLTYYLCGGGLIGAVRHGGFIPWDDDIDVFMPRDDYEKLKEIWLDNSEYSIQFTKKDFKTENQFLTICANNTTFIKTYQKDLDINHGVMLDVIPLDGCPKGFARKKQKIYALLYSLFIIGKAPTNHSKLVYLGGKFLLGLIPKCLYYKIWSFCERQMTKYSISECDAITELCSGPHYMQNEYPKDIFENRVLLDFEGYKLPAPQGYDIYLKMAFGDYMTPPPENERICHHEYEVIDLSNTYKIYKGKKYFTECGVFMTADEFKGLQQKNLEITLMFDKFCKEHNLKYFLCGGACIGAVRHKGFIPWDDDIDVFMPRSDYERLKEIWQNTDKYKLCRTNENTFYRSMISAISDEQTTFIKERQKDLDIEHGIRLEILPLDGCPNGKLKRKMQILWALTYQIYNNQEPPTSKGKFLEIIGKIMLFIFPTWNMRYKVSKFAERQMTKYSIENCSKITELCSRYQYMVNEYPKEIFETAELKNFEGVMLPLPKGYDEYLKMAFGNYMELPEKSEQIPKHDAVMVDLENSYKKYKNIYYPKKI